MGNDLKCVTTENSDGRNALTGELACGKLKLRNGIFSKKKIWRGVRGRFS
jgi:hypothetical protein